LVGGHFLYPKHVTPFGGCKSCVLVPTGIVHYHK
jgi:hypothetical protein